MVSVGNAVVSVFAVCVGNGAPTEDLVAGLSQASESRHLLTVIGARQVKAHILISAESARQPRWQHGHDGEALIINTSWPSTTISNLLVITNPQRRQSVRFELTRVVSFYQVELKADDYQ